MKTVKNLCVFIVVALSSIGPEALAQANGSDIVFNFDNEEAGKLPSDWTAATSTWMIASDGSNKAMKQAGKNEGDRFNICVQNKLKYQNLEIEVKIGRAHV